MKISVIILNWDGKEDTKECLESVEKSRITDYKLQSIVVDNGSTDGSQKAVKNFYKKARKDITWELIENRENLGFAEGNNVGMRYALKSGADFIMLLNNDTIIDKNLFVDLINAAKNYPKAGIISPKIYFAKGFEYHKKRYKKNELGRVIWYAGGDVDWNNIYGSNHGVDEVDKGQFDKVADTDFATGCCMFFRSKVLKDLGLFDKKYFAYLEDSDLSQRAKKAGWRVLYTPKPHLWHKVGQALGVGSEKNDYYITRNRLLFGLRHARLRTKVALIKESIKLLLKGRKWQRIAIRDFYLGRFGKGSWA
ncbi:glycosyltransferase family 2 protein [Patescibacteria group bacterium]|nr:glycosyltransferase family 2 protein [Patescibacteria group bacterium]